MLKKGRPKKVEYKESERFANIKERDKVIREEIKKVPKGSLGIFKNIADTAWFRQYAKKGKRAIKNISKDVLKGIKEGKYTDYSQPEQPSGFIKPEIKQKKPKIKKQRVKKQKQEKIIRPVLPPEVKKQKRKEYRKLYNQRPEVKEYNRLRKAAARKRSKNNV